MDLLYHLKTATTVAHESLERELDLLRPSLTLAEYVELLECFYGFWSPWEALAGRILSPDFFDPRRKVALLEQDLRRFGRNPQAVLRALPKPELPVLRTRDAALGSMYVIEGSTLGGQLLSRHFEKAFGFSNGEGDSFFRSYGPETGRMWRQFGETLKSVSSPEGEQQAVSAANDTFIRLREWFAATKDVHV